MAVRIGRVLTEASERLADIIAAYINARKQVDRRIANRREEDMAARRSAGFGNPDPSREAEYEAMREQGLQSARQTALEAIDSLEAEVDAEIDRIKSAVDSELYPTPETTEEQLLEQARQGRIWDRLVRILDAEYARSQSIYSALDAAIELAQEAGDGETFLVLRQEIGPWVRAHDEGLRAPTYRLHVDKAMKDHLDEGQLQAMQILAQVESSFDRSQSGGGHSIFRDGGPMFGTGIDRVQDAIGQARQAIRGRGRSLEMLETLPGWKVDHDIRISSGS